MRGVRLRAPGVQGAEFGPTRFMVPTCGVPLTLRAQSDVLQLPVRRFTCRNAECPRRTFIEQIPGLTQRHGQRTERQRSTLAAIGLTLAGVPVSRNTVLRLVDALPEPEAPAPRVVRVDEYATRKGPPLRHLPRWAFHNLGMTAIVEAAWHKILGRAGDASRPEASPLQKPFTEMVRVAHAEPRLRQLYPWTGMWELHFSRCTEFRPTWASPTSALWETVGTTSRDQAGPARGSP